MRGIKLIIWAVGLSIVAGTGMTGPAIAQNTQSDFTGVNTSNNTAPRFGFDSNSDSGASSGFSSQVASTAAQISQNLTDAYAAYVAAETAASTTTSRIARGPLDPDEVCTNPELQRLNTAQAEANTFLNSLDTSQAEQLRASPAFRIW